MTTSADLADTVSGSLSTASDLASNVGKWLSIAVLVAAFLVAGLLTSSAVSRRVREFGTLKALGWKSGRVTRQVVGEAIVNGLLGGALGIALGLGGAYVVTAISPTLKAELASSGGGPGGGGPGGGFGGPARQTASKALDVALTAPVSLSTVAVALAVTGGLIAGAFGGWRARERAAAALESVGLAERLGHLPAELSGGQQQRVAVARALVKQPKVLLADEPTGNLDESMRDEIMDVLEAMWKEHGLTFIMVTHDSAIAKKAPRVAMIREGRITVKENAGV